jgi:hypothetical protein
LDHSVPTFLYDTEDVPEEFKGTSAPSIGAVALCQIKSGRSVSELELVRPFTSSGAVKLCFQIPDRKGRWQPSFQVGQELMWVTVDECEGEWANVTYRGKLVSFPVFFGPEQLRIGSTVTFQLRHVVTNLGMSILPTTGCRLCIEKDSKPWLTVNYRVRKPAYPLTTKGIREAGRDLYDSGETDWTYSSGVDFPEEFGCRLDIRVTLEGAFVARAEEFGDTRFSGVELGLVGRIKQTIEALKENKSEDK